MGRIRTTEIMGRTKVRINGKKREKNGRSRMLGRKGRKHRLRKFEKC